MELRLIAPVPSRVLTVSPVLPGIIVKMVWDLMQCRVLEEPTAQVALVSPLLVLPDITARQDPPHGFLARPVSTALRIALLFIRAKQALGVQPYRTNLRFALSVLWLTTLLTHLIL